jgi:hypothetical protein
MQRILRIAMAPLALSVAVFGQPSSRHARLSKSEKELIAISRKYVDTAIAKEVVIETGNLRSTPLGLMGAAEVKGRWDSVALVEPVVRIDGKQATVAARVVWHGHPDGIQTMNQSSDVRISFVREKAEWKPVNLCLGACSPN